MIKVVEFKTDFRWYHIPHPTPSFSGEDIAICAIEREGYYDDTWTAIVYAVDEGFIHEHHSDLEADTEEELELCIKDTIKEIAKEYYEAYADDAQEINDYLNDLRIKNGEPVVEINQQHE